VRRNARRTVKAEGRSADWMRRVDQVLALVELQQPQWKLRRLPTARAFLAAVLIAPHADTRNAPAGWHLSKHRVRVERQANAVNVLNVLAPSRNA
jgi:hypothetical protein